MSLKLYYAPGACSFVPHALLETAGAAFEPLQVKLHRGEQNEAAFRAVNPRGQVPVLVDGEQVITQIVAIVLHIDALFPGQEFLPREQRARTRVVELLAWMNNTVHPTFTHVFMPQKFTDSPEAQAAIKRYNAEVYRGLLGEIDALARKAQAEGRGFLAGERLGPLDIYALTLLRWGGYAGIDPTGFETLWAHVQKVAAEPGPARAVERERLQLNVYKAA
ncbi:glutathione S-transferase family protein [Ramlibacter sp.]|uniref:glutathione S-transferase family protein n=1 Tax=Ramlibacter sp. TaxID=1917967 RepID=UPI0035AF0F6C